MPASAVGLMFWSRIIKPCCFLLKRKKVNMPCHFLRKTWIAFLTFKEYMSSSVYIAGVGVISAIGNNVAEHLAAFEREDAGMADITMLNTIHRGELPVAEVKLDNAQLVVMTG